MTFGLLSTGQTVLVAAFATAAVLVVFFLRVRHPLVEVPSLVLWHRVLDEQRRDSLLERLRRLLSLLLALAIAWLLVLAIAEPRPDGPRDGRIALVIDNSATMNALMPDGEVRLARAKNVARALVEQAGANARFQVADTTGVIRTPPDLDRRAALDAIERVRPGFGAVRMPAGATGYDLVVLTDGVRLEPPQAAHVVSLHGPIPNAGITAFEIRATPALPHQHSVYLSVVNFDPTPREVQVSVGAPGRPRVQRTIALAAGGSLRDVLPVDELDPGIVEARVTSPGDRFALDDVAYAWLPDRRVWRVVLVTQGQPALAAVLQADPQVVLQLVTPDAYRPALDADVFVFDRFTPDAAPRQPALLFGPSASAWLPLDARTRTLPAIQVTDAAHPLMAAVAVDDLHVARTAVIAAPEAATLAADAGHPVMAAGRATAPWVAVGFALDDSNFASQPSFPIFVANTMHWLRGQVHAITARPGLVEVPGTAAAVVDVGGRDVPAHVSIGSTRFTTEGPGVFFATSSGVRRPVMVNFADEAALREAHTNGDTMPGTPQPPVTRSVPWWSVLAGVAFLLLAAEWWTWHRRITV